MMQTHSGLCFRRAQGRPKGGPEDKYRLAPDFKRLQQLLRVPVLYVDDCIGDKVRHTHRRARARQLRLRASCVALSRTAFCLAQRGAGAAQRGACSARVG